MLKVVQHFSKHSSCHLQGECLLVGYFWKSYIGQAVGAVQDVMNLTSRAEEQAAI
jgi:hypothetical protein